jgi:hypothetical protein
VHSAGSYPVAFFSFLLNVVWKIKPYDERVRKLITGIVVWPVLGAFALALTHSCHTAHKTLPGGPQFKLRMTFNEVMSPILDQLVDLTVLIED